MQKLIHDFSFLPRTIGLPEQPDCPGGLKISPSATEFYIETVLDSMILRRKIIESSTVSNCILIEVVQKGFCRLRRQNILLRDASFSRFRFAKS
jgi:hypothetical protein